jgi:uncharacterized iron-regulated protein
MRYVIAVFLVLQGCAVWAGSLGDAQIVLIGETHDNPMHHETQAALVKQIAPTALVFEMLSDAQAARVDADLVADQALMRSELDWDASGWPDFAMYHPIFAAAPEARVYGGAVPRSVLHGVVEGDVTQAFDQPVLYGLDQDLPIQEQAARQALQFAAHCEALPEETLPGMVNVQRVRDARLAQAAIQALSETGGPVVVILGNGHARKDWGMPRVLNRVAPDVSVWSVGQSEDGSAPLGGFDQVIDAPSVARPDPCAAFK